jgi:hypothetical protein
MASLRSRRQHRLSAPSSLAILIAIAGLALAGCNQTPPANAVSDNSAAVNALAAADAPADADLPEAAPPPVTPATSAPAAYAYADQASAMSDAFADAPPDYTYDYDGVQPSVWRTHDNYERIVEQTASGPRVYYFAPGAAQPFYIQASDYGYGFQGGALVAVYDSRGHQLAPDAITQRADMAGRFLQRARGLQQGAAQQPHQSAPPPNWTQQRDALDAQRDHQAQDQHDNPDWQTWHAQHGAADATRWAEDQVQRLVQASQADRSMHDDSRADHDWQAAQDTARAHHQPPPQPPPPPGPPGTPPTNATGPGMPPAGAGPDHGGPDHGDHGNSDHGGQDHSGQDHSGQDHGGPGPSGQGPSGPPAPQGDDHHGHDGHGGPPDTNDAHRH